MSDEDALSDFCPSIFVIQFFKEYKSEYAVSSICIQGNSLG